MEAIINSLSTLSLNELLVLKFDIDREIVEKKRAKEIVTIEDESLFG